MESATQSPSPKPHIAIFPLSCGMGHLIPTAELAKRLCSYHGFSVTFILSKWMWKTQQQDVFIQRLASSAPDIHFAYIPEVALDEDDEDMKMEVLISKFMLKAKTHVENVLESLLNSSSPISAFVTDLFCTAFFDFTAKLNIPTYIFFTAPASLLCLMFRLPQLVSEIEVSFKDADFAVQVPGLPLIPARDLPTPILDRTDSAFHWFVHHSSRLQEAKGILINTFAELEEKAIEALTEGKVLSAPATPSIYPVGPLISESHWPDDSECLKWLDQQSPSSVLFVSFGSGAFLSAPQIAEVAHGLEASGHRFLWVVRGPYKFINSFRVPDTDLSQLLPEGFESRSKGRGLVVPNWAPQIPVLSHPSVGGFLSHCGWNSTLESVSYGVPIIAWPLFAEQRMNKILLVEEIKVAVDIKIESDGIVKREEVERVVRELMEGEGKVMREKMKELKEKAKIAMSEGGSSYQSMAAAAAQLSQRPEIDS